MRLTRKYVVVATAIIIASFLLGTAVLAAPKPKANKGNLAKPDYDSGWVSANWGTEDMTFTHNLGTRDLFVYIYYEMNDPTIPGDHHWTHNIRADTVYWTANDYNAIVVHFPETPDYVFQNIRVLIWAIPD